MHAHTSPPRPDVPLSYWAVMVEWHRAAGAAVALVGGVDLVVRMGFLSDRARRVAIPVVAVAQCGRVLACPTAPYQLATAAFLLMGLALEDADADAKANGVRGTAAALVGLCAMSALAHLDAALQIGTGAAGRPAGPMAARTYVLRSMCMLAAAGVLAGPASWSAADDDALFEAAPQPCPATQSSLRPLMYALFWATAAAAWSPRDVSWTLVAAALTNVVLATAAVEYVTAPPPPPPLPAWCAPPGGARLRFVPPPPSG